MLIGKCAIWNTDAEISTTERDGREINSNRAGGRYFITGSALASIHNLTELEKSKVTSWLINQRALGIECPEIFTKNLDEASNAEQINVTDRAHRILSYIENKTKKIGENYYIPIYGVDDSLLAHSESTLMSEVDYLLRDYLAEIGFIKIFEKQSNSNPGRYITITPKGYLSLTEARNNPTKKNQAFVAMWFDPSLLPAYEDGISKAVMNTGFTPIRIDGLAHNGKIDDMIISEIRSSSFLIADFTQEQNNARGGVYYEAGFAHGLNIPVIFTCRDDSINFVHFDTRQYNHILWSTPEELRSKLEYRIRATIGDRIKN